MALLDALEALPASPLSARGGKCSVGVLLARLDEKERATLVRLLDYTPDIEATAIAGVLNDEGHPVAAHAVSRHRRRGQGNGCRCAQ